MKRSRPAGAKPALSGDTELIRARLDLADEHSGWTVEGEFRAHRGNPLLTRLTIEPTEEGLVPVAGITARLLRNVRLGDLYAELGTAPDAALSLLGISERDDYRETRRPGRKGRPDVTYAVWAARYVEKCAQGSRRPIEELASDHDETPRAVRDLIHRARERSLLVGGSQGRVGGALSEHAIELLTDEAEGQLQHDRRGPR